MSNQQTKINAERKAAFVSKLSSTAPEGSLLEVGDWVDWVNDYGVEWTHKILGFQYGDEYGDKYNKHVILDKEAYWFPLGHQELTKSKAK